MNPAPNMGVGCGGWLARLFMPQGWRKPPSSTESTHHGKQTAQEPCSDHEVSRREPRTRDLYLPRYGERPLCAKTIAAAFRPNEEPRVRCGGWLGQEFPNENIPRR